MNCAVAEVIGGNQPVVTNLLLKTEVPLINVGRMVVRSIAVVRREGRECHILRNEIREGLGKPTLVYGSSKLVGLIERYVPNGALAPCELYVQRCA